MDGGIPEVMLFVSLICKTNHLDSCSFQNLRGNLGNQLIFFFSAKYLSKGHFEKYQIWPVFCQVLKQRKGNFSILRETWARASKSLPCPFPDLYHQPWWVFEVRVGMEMPCWKQQQHELQMFWQVVSRKASL